MPKKQSNAKETLEQVTVEKVNEKNEATAETEEVIVGTGAPDKVEDDGYVTYCLPFLPGVKPGDYQTVTINGKNYQVKYGEAVRMPKGVADVLKEMVKGRTLVEKKIEKLQEETCITTLK